MALRKNAKLELLKRVPLFADCSKRELDEVAKIADELDFREGKVLTREGAAGREFFVIVEGTAEATQGRKRLRTMSDGDFFGEISLITRLPRTATVTTISPMRALVVSDRSFRRLLQDDHAIRRKVLSALGERLETP
ncbi:MAG TPA: cyclic nucleotide-binding domain-containing protein [Gaiellaceae bacterium]|nr:cyclic nucleotide-binding domain-containing protein [Gaiellaceae bacterium]